MNISPPSISDKEKLHQTILDELSLVFASLDPRWAGIGLEQVRLNVSAITGFPVDDNDIRDAIISYSHSYKSAWLAYISGLVEPFSDVLENIGMHCVLLPDEVQYASGINPVGFVYLFRVSGSITSFKIGISKDPEARALTIAQPGLEVEVIHTFPANDARAAEQLLHDRFHSKRVAREYFDLNDYDINWLRSITRFVDGEFLMRSDL